jgi:hypothetical protein
LGTFILAFFTLWNVPTMQAIPRDRSPASWGSREDLDPARLGPSDESATDPVVRSLKFDVKNYGHGPARQSRLLIHAAVHRLSQPEEERAPTYREAESEVIGGTVSPQEVVHSQYSSRQALALSDDTLIRFNSRNPRGDNLFLHGFIEYLDGHN